MPRLIGIFGFVRSYFHAPSVSANRGDLLFLAPVTIFEFHAGRVSASIAAPFALGQTAFHLSGADNDKIAFADLHILLLSAFIEFIIGNAFAILHPFHAAKARDVE